MAGLAAAGWGLAAKLAKCFVKQVLGAGLECVYHQLAKDLVDGEQGGLAFVGRGCVYHQSAKDLVAGSSRQRSGIAGLAFGIC